MCDSSKAHCPTCGPTTTEPHPRAAGVVRCSNCKEHLDVCDSSCNPNVTQAQAHCRACCVTFSSVALFDSHRTGDVDRRKCLSPETVGLQNFGGVWAPLSYQDTLDRLEVARANRGR